MTREIMKPMHLAICAAIVKAMQDNPEITPRDVFDYWKEAAQGLSVMAAFTPSRETFILNLTVEE